MFIKLAVFLTGIMNPAYHPLHVSICNIELNGKENIVSVKLFKDDFALALKNNFQVDIPMEKADESSNSLVISKYINTCFQIEVNNEKNLELKYNYSEINEDAVWFYFKCEKLPDAKKLTIRNRLMLDLWDDQTNLVIISWKGKENGYRFNKDEVEIEIDLNN